MKIALNILAMTTAVCAQPEPLPGRVHSAQAAPMSVEQTDLTV